MQSMPSSPTQTKRVIFCIWLCAYRNPAYPIARAGKQLLHSFMHIAKSAETVLIVVSFRILFSPRFLLGQHTFHFR